MNESRQPKNVCSKLHRMVYVGLKGIGTKEEQLLTEAGI